ncbi:hypothetical protein BO71DRAFT_397960 [Aspergillus ellipticus CBS 707.79]|uniref:Uncharacterized protein n=1 Tax=Aspergillus ellipticus CBS 707.79 TaxID=1448320 RepID=A0A319DDZ7_9EURO|nr:hypothetical protein BO71DRAFT_397960 [Aspergillus ellipticus CBS 707.79]
MLLSLLYRRQPTSQPHPTAITTLRRLSPLPPSRNFFPCQARHPTQGRSVTPSALVSPHLFYDIAPGAATRPKASSRSHPALRPRP